MAHKHHKRAPAHAGQQLALVVRSWIFEEVCVPCQLRDGTVDGELALSWRNGTRGCHLGIEVHRRAFRGEDVDGVHQLAGRTDGDATTFKLFLGDLQQLLAVDLLLGQLVRVLLLEPNIDSPLPHALHRPRVGRIPCLRIRGEGAAPHRRTFESFERCPSQSLGRTPDAWDEPRQRTHAWKKQNTVTAEETCLTEQRQSRS